MAQLFPDESLVDSPGCRFNIALSVDLDEWYHSQRWLDGEQSVRLPDRRALFRRIYSADRPCGEILGPTRQLLQLFRRFEVKCTFFALGEIAEWYPDLIREIASQGHEIGSHGLNHVDMTVLGPETFRQHLRETGDALQRLTGERPTGFRAPNLVYEPWATRILEAEGFLYDSSVVASRAFGGKYRGWKNAPTSPYHPAYSDIAKRGDAKLFELPLPPVPLIRLPAGSGIMTRAFGRAWTLTGLCHALRNGHTGYYCHPWEVGPRPLACPRTLKSRVFFRRTGPWMLRTLENLLERFASRIVPCHRCALDVDPGPVLIEESTSQGLR